ncbi:MAG: beta-galactosidase, partial [Deltaproteobacteria bacterium]|nr:beta-galactosidase [Deltaproteobacteria bacterium]
VGYYVDDLPSFAELYRRVWSPSASKAFVRFLGARYPVIRDLNAAWGTSYASYDALVADKPDPQPSSGAQTAQTMLRDFKLFARETVARYVQLTASIVREEDPGHLVFSPRLEAGRGLVDAAPYLDLFAPFDAVAVTVHPADVTAGLSPAELAMLELVYASSGRPVIATGLSVPARDSGLYATASSESPSWESFTRSVGTQESRATQAYNVLASLYNMPFVIGAHWESWRDADGDDKRRENLGLVKKDGKRYRELTQALTAFNARVYRSRGAPLAAAPPAAGPDARKAAATAVAAPVVDDVVDLRRKD